MSVDNRKKFLAELDAESECDFAEVDRQAHEVVTYQIFLTDDVGSAVMSESPNEPGEFDWEITLGPENSKKLLKFLRGLPAEPGWGEDDTGEG